MDSFYSFIKEQLKRYIKEEDRKGVPLDRIEQALLDAGHKQNVIDECFNELKEEEAGLPVDSPEEEEQQEAVTDIKDAIKNFFGKLQSKEVTKVKKNIKKAGTEEIVEDAIEEYEEEKEQYLLEGFAFFAYLVALAVLVLYTAGQVGDDVLLVAVGLAPAFINAFISFALIKFSDYVPAFMLIPVFVSGVFYALGTFGDVGLLSRMEIESLSIINAVIAMAFSVLLIALSQIKPRPIHDFHDKTVPQLPAAALANKSRREKIKEKQAQITMDTQAFEAAGEDQQAESSQHREHPHIKELKEEFRI